MHISGELREASDKVWALKTGTAHEVLTEDELELQGLLADAAEKLDDAHEAWLRAQLAIVHQFPIA